MWNDIRCDVPNDGERILIPVDSYCGGVYGVGICSAIWYDANNTGTSNSVKACDGGVYRVKYWMQAPDFPDLHWQNKKHTCRHVSSGHLNYMQTDTTCAKCGADMWEDV